MPPYQPHFVAWLRSLGLADDTPIDDCPALYHYTLFIMAEQREYMAYHPQLGNFSAWLRAKWGLPQEQSCICRPPMEGCPPCKRAHDHFATVQPWGVPQARGATE